MAVSAARIGRLCIIMASNRAASPRRTRRTRGKPIRLDAPRGGRFPGGSTAKGPIDAFPAPQGPGSPRQRFPTRTLRVWEVVVLFAPTGVPTGEAETPVGTSCAPESLPQVWRPGPPSDPRRRFSPQIDGGSGRHGVGGCPSKPGSSGAPVRDSRKATRSSISSSDRFRRTRIRSGWWLGRAFGRVE